MTRRRHRQRNRALTGLLIAGLCVGIGAIAFRAVLPRFDFTSSPTPPASNSTSTTTVSSTARSLRPL
jgi:hypothetical protein